MRIFCTLLLVLLFAAPAFGQGTQVIRTPLTTNRMMNAPSDAWIPIWNNVAKQWSNGVNTASATNNAQPPSTVLSNLTATGVAPGATNAGAYIGSNAGLGTNTSIFTSLTSKGKTTNENDLEVRGGDLNLFGTNASPSIYQMYSIGPGLYPFMFMHSANGTEAAPTQKTAGEQIGEFGIDGRDNGASYRNGFSFRAYAMSDFTTTSSETLVNVFLGNNSAGKNTWTWTPYNSTNDANLWVKSNLTVRGSATVDNVQTNHSGLYVDSGFSGGHGEIVLLNTNTASWTQLRLLDYGAGNVNVFLENYGGTVAAPTAMALGDNIANLYELGRASAQSKTAFSLRTYALNNWTDGDSRALATFNLGDNTGNTEGRTVLTLTAFNATNDVNVTINSNLTVELEAVVNKSLRVPYLPSNTVAVLGGQSRLTNAANRFYYETNVAQILSNLVAAAASGDVVELGVGTFNIGVQTIRVPVGVRLKGQGIDKTIISGTVGLSTNYIVQIMSSNIVEDLTVSAGNRSAYLQNPVGFNTTLGHPSATNAVIRRVKMDGETDAFLAFSVTFNSGEMEDCILLSKWDAYRQLGPGAATPPPGQWTVRRTTIISDVRGATEANTIANNKATPIKIENSANVEFIDCDVIATNGLSSICLYSATSSGTHTNRVSIAGGRWQAAGTNVAAKIDNSNTALGQDNTPVVVQGTSMSDADGYFDTIFSVPSLITFLPLQASSFRASSIKMTGGQTASRALVLDSGTNVITATGTPDGTKFLRDDNTYAVPTGSVTPGGNSGAVQFNEGGAFAGTNTFAFDRTNNILSVSNITLQNMRWIDNTVAGVGGALTNFTLLAGRGKTVINGFTNVSIRAIMGGTDGFTDTFSITITNGSGSNRTLEFSAVTNNWRWSYEQGGIAPTILTNSEELLILGELRGTNITASYGYFPWP